MESGLPREDAAFVRKEVAPKEWLGPRPRHVQNIYDYQVYQTGGGFVAVDSRSHSLLGPFPSQAAAVKGVMQAYVALGQPRAANPGFKALDHSHRVGYFTNRGTSI